MNRLGVFVFFLLSSISALVPLESLAQTTVVVSKPKSKFTIAIPAPCNIGAQVGSNQKLSNTISRDLLISGHFDVLNPESFISNNSVCQSGVEERYEDWRLIKSDWLVRGAITRVTPLKLTINLYLHDVLKGQQVLGKQYDVTREELASVAHRFSNAILKYISGEEGPFGSKIAFVSRVGRFKELFLMDMDGGNVRQLTREKGLALAPAYGPSGDLLLYTSYKSRLPDLHVISIKTGQSRGLTRSPILEIGGDFSPDGSSVITSVSGANKDSDLVVYDRTGRVVSRYGVGNGAIDVSPSFSPDGKEYVFCSDRSGNPQIYRASLGGNETKRVSYVNSNYCTSPDWSPKGDKISFVCRANGGFQLFIANSDGSNSKQITHAGNNEDPAWSPDGNYLTFSSTFGKRSGFDIALVRVAGQGENESIKQLTFNPADDTDPAWGPIKQ